LQAVFHLADETYLVKNGGVWVLGSVRHGFEIDSEHGHEGLHDERIALVLRYKSTPRHLDSAIINAQVLAGHVPG
jgi:hypothetical protein